MSATRKLVQMLLHGWSVFLWILSLFSPLCISLSSSIRCLPFFKIQYSDSSKKKEKAIISVSFLSSPPSTFLSFSISGELCQFLTISSATTVLPVSSVAPPTSMSLGSLFVSPPPDPVSFSSLQTNVHSVSWLLWLSPTDIKLYTVHLPGLVLLLTSIQTWSHLASESADTTVYLLSFLSKTLGNASLLNIFHRTACGIPTALSKHEMHLCQHDSEDISMGVWANKPDYHFI